jgi:hypothetical protein
MSRSGKDAADDGEPDETGGKWPLVMEAAGELMAYEIWRKRSNII